LAGLLGGLLKWQAELRPEEFAANWGASPDAIRRALSLLGSRGLVGYDLSRGAYYHRVLPFDLALVESIHPRLASARKLVAEGGVKVVRRAGDVIETEVPGSGVAHRVRLSPAGDRCSCPWHAKHQGNRGPCKHILAAQLVADALEKISYGS
jgi:hypothetical protein